MSARCRWNHERGAVDHCSLHAQAIDDVCAAAQAAARKYAEDVYAYRAAKGDPVNDGGRLYAHRVAGAGAYAYQRVCEDIVRGLYGPCDDGTRLGCYDDDDGSCDDDFDDHHHHDPADGPLNGLMLRRTQQAAMRGVR